MEKIAFTICSNNYLAQAKTLGDSLLVHNPDYTFIIGLVDKFSDQIDYSYFVPHEILPVEAVPISNFDEMVLKYNITELNTAVKPFIFKFLFDRSNRTANITYLDPDIFVYDTFTDLETAYKENTFILTPHITSAINDNLLLSEEAFLNCGLYNLGFLGLNRTGRVFEFLDWWMERLKDRCYSKVEKGWFVDQIWINFVPLYYEGAFILRHPGYNTAYWNLHERSLESRNGNYFINQNSPLIFYHFSGFNPLKADVVSKYQTRYSFENRPDLTVIFENYKNAVLQNKHEEFSTIICHYVEVRNQHLTEKLKKSKTTSFKLEVKKKVRKFLHLNN